MQKSVSQLFDIIKLTFMSSAKKKMLSESSVLLGGLSSLQNKQNLNGDEIKEMVDLLKAYETLCIQRQDFNGADSVKNKIEQLKGQELIHRKETIAVREKQQIQVICKEGEKEIKQFQGKWDMEIKSLIDELKQNEEELIRIQKKQMEQFIQKLEHEDPPKIKYSSHILEKKKYLSNLIKIRNYKEAEIIKMTLKQIQAEEEVKWGEKWVEKKHLRVEKMQKKQIAQLQAFRVRLEGIFNEKIKQRDRKFQILLKKNRKRRIESSKPSRERIMSRNGMLSELRMTQSKMDRSYFQKGE